VNESVLLDFSIDFYFLRDFSRIDKKVAPSLSNGYYLNILNLIRNKTTLGFFNGRLYIKTSDYKSRGVWIMPSKFRMENPHGRYTHITIKHL